MWISTCVGVFEHLQGCGEVSTMLPAHLVDNHQLRRASYHATKIVGSTFAPASTLSPRRANSRFAIPDRPLVVLLQDLGARFLDCFHQVIRQRGGN